MKKTGYLTAALLLFAQPAFAMLPLTPATIQAAQSTGRNGKGPPWANCWHPGPSTTGSSGTLRLRERAVVYTPFLTAAVDARQTAADGGTPSVPQGMKVAKQYDGVLALGLNLSTSVKLEPGT